jgi:hypothetical protein
LANLKLVEESIRHPGSGGHFSVLQALSLFLLAMARLIAIYSLVNGIVLAGVVGSARRKASRDPLFA